MEKSIWVQVPFRAPELILWLFISVAKGSFQVKEGALLSLIYRFERSFRSTMSFSTGELVIILSWVELARFKNSSLVSLILLELVSLLVICSYSSALACILDNILGALPLSCGKNARYASSLSSVN